MSNINPLKIIIDVLNGNIKISEEGMKEVERKVLNILDIIKRNNIPPDVDDWTIDHFLAVSLNLTTSLNKEEIIEKIKKEIPENSLDYYKYGYLSGIFNYGLSMLLSLYYSREVSEYDLIIYSFVAVDLAEIAVRHLDIKLRAREIPRFYILGYHLKKSKIENLFKK